MKAVLDQDKLASLINVLQTGEHGQALSNADLFILVPPEQVGHIRCHIRCHVRCHVHCHIRCHIHSHLRCHVRSHIHIHTYDVLRDNNFQQNPRTMWVIIRFGRLSTWVPLYSGGVPLEQVLINLETAGHSDHVAMWEKPLHTISRVVQWLMKLVT